LAFQEYFKAAATSNFWIPACAGMTVEVSAKIAHPVFGRLFALSLLRFFAVGRILESDISNSGFSETIDASNVLSDTSIRPTF